MGSRTVTASLEPTRQRVSDAGAGGGRAPVGLAAPGAAGAPDLGLRPLLPARRPVRELRLAGRHGAAWT